MRYVNKHDAKYQTILYNTLNNFMMKKQLTRLVDYHIMSINELFSHLPASSFFRTARYLCHTQLCSSCPLMCNPSGKCIVMAYTTLVCKIS